MNLIPIIIVMVIGIHFLFEFYNRIKIKKKNLIIISIYSRIKFPYGPMDIPRLLLFSFLFYLGYSRIENYGFSYVIAVIIVFSIHYMKRIDRITLTNEYIFFNMTYLKLSDIDDIYIADNKYLVIDSKKLIFNTIRIEYINNIEEVAGDLSKGLNN